MKNRRLCTSFDMQSSCLTHCIIHCITGLYSTIISMNSRDKLIALKQALKFLRKIERSTIVLDVMLSIFGIRKN